MKQQKFKKVRTSNDIANDPRVDGISYEGDDGWWVILKDDWVFAPDTHIIHEYSIKDCCDVLNNVVYYEGAN